MKALVLVAVGVLLVVGSTAYLFSTSSRSSPQSAQGTPAAVPPKAIMHSVTYFEIPVTNLERAMKFYQAVFGTDFTRETVDGNEMAFFPFSERAPGATGALAKGDTYVPSKNGSRVYFHSDDIDATLTRVVNQGGKVLYPKTSIGAQGTVAEFEDSEGNRIALHSPAR